jgi:hypothetical protein
MKKKSRKSRKQYLLFKVVLYTSEGEANYLCSIENCTNTVSGCGMKEAVNYRCNPPKSTARGAVNVECNLVMNC